MSWEIGAFEYKPAGGGGVTLTIVSGSYTLTGFVVAATIGVVTTSSEAAVNTAGGAPTASVGKVITAGIHNVTSLGLTPSSVDIGQSLQAISSSLSSSPVGVITLTKGNAFVGTGASLSSTSAANTLSVGNILSSPSLATLLLSPLPPSLSTGCELTTSEQSCVSTYYSGTLVKGLAVTSVNSTVNITQYAATSVIGNNLTSDTLTLTTSYTAPTLITINTFNDSWQIDSNIVSTMQLDVNVLTASVTVGNILSTVKFDKEL